MNIDTVTNVQYVVHRTIFMVTMFGLLTMVAEAGNDITNYTDPITYVSYADNTYGFYKVRDVTTYKSAPFDPSTHTITIKQGDRIIWKNDAEKGIALTLVSEQGLFADVGLGSNFQYNFEQTGTFTFHIKEYPGKKLTVVVNPGYSIHTPITTPTVPMSITVIPMSTTVRPMSTTVRPMSAPIIQFPPITQITSIIVAILSIYITYKIGKGR